jgi:hypothetical protein
MAIAVSGTQVNLYWNSVSGASAYLIDEWINGAWRQLGSVGSGTTGVAVTGLTPGTTYYFDVGAYGWYGVKWANYQAVTTLSTNSTTFDHPTAAAYSNVSGSLFGAGGPSYLDVRQGAVGDCWLMAGLAEVAARAPSIIQNMFTYNGTAGENGVTVGVYTVHLFGTDSRWHNVVVDTMLPSGGNYYDHVVNGVLWVALAEKAYAQANGMGFVTTRYVGKDSYSALDGGSPSWALQAITGRPAGDFAINPSNLVSAWSAGKFIVLGSSSNPSSQYIVGGSDGTHAYAIVAYNGSSSMAFTVYNPWGTDSQGWALGLYHGHKVYGLFICNGAFLSSNFASQSLCGEAEGGTPGTFCIVCSNTPSLWENMSTGTASPKTPAAPVAANEGWLVLASTDLRGRASYDRKLWMSG